MQDHERRAYEEEVARLKARREDAYRPANLIAGIIIAALIFWAFLKINEQGFFVTR